MGLRAQLGIAACNAAMQPLSFVLSSAIEPSVTQTKGRSPTTWPSQFLRESIGSEAQQARAVAQNAAARRCTSVPVDGAPPVAISAPAAPAAGPGRPPPAPPEGSTVVDSPPRPAADVSAVLGGDLQLSTAATPNRLHLTVLPGPIILPDQHRSYALASSVSVRFLTGVWMIPKPAPDQSETQADSTASQSMNPGFSKRRGSWRRLAAQNPGQASPKCPAHAADVVCPKKPER